MRKIFITITTIIVLAAAAWAGYFWYVKSDSVSEQQTEARQLKVVFENGAVSPISSFSNQGIWFGTQNGRLMSYDLVAEAATEYPIPQVLGESFKKLVWPKQGNDFIAVSSFEGADLYSYFSSADKRYYALPPHVINLDWMESSRQVALTWRTDSGEILLVVSNPDASGYKVLTSLPWSDMVIKASPTHNTALMYRANSSGPVNKIYLFDLETGEYSEAISTGRNTGAVWSPNGQGFVYSQLVDGRNKVYYHELLSSSTTDLGLATSIDKVSFNHDGSRVYIAATRSDDSGEDIWEYEFDSGMAQVVFSSDTLRVKNIIIIGQKLFFLGNDQVLYSYQR